MKKGFLFGSALVILALIVLALAISVSKINTQRDSDMLRLSVYDRIDDEIKATQNGYRDMLGYFIKINKQGNKITFSETLPDTSASGFFTFTNNFKTFVEGNSSFKIKIDLTGITSKLPLRIQPLGILYNHPSDFGQEMIEVTNAQQVIGYNITILLNKTGATPVEWDTGPVNVSQGINVNIVTGGLTGNDFTYSGNLSRTQLSKLKIKLPGDDMFVEIGNAGEPGRLQITNNNEDTATFVNTTLVVNATQFYAALPDQSINITAGEYNISKVDTMRVS